MPSHKTKAVQIDAALASVLIADFAKPNKLPKWARDQVSHFQIKLDGADLLICTKYGSVRVHPNNYVLCSTIGELSAMSADEFSQKFGAV